MLMCIETASLEQQATLCWFERWIGHSAPNHSAQLCMGQHPPLSLTWSSNLHWRPFSSSNSVWWLDTLSTTMLISISLVTKFQSSSIVGFLKSHLQLLCCQGIQHLQWPTRLHRCPPPQVLVFVWVLLVASPRKHLWINRTVISDFVVCF